MPRFDSPDLLVGVDTMDDAGVFRLSADTTIVQTADMFPPVVNDPVAYGRILSANATSDVWAMGGTPRTALALLNYPPADIPLEVIALIMRGIGEKLLEAGVVLVGGHTHQDDTICCGLSVTGVIDPNRILTNADARVGDALVLTKPLGSGVLCAAFDQEGLPRDVYDAFVGTMERLNKYACETLLKHPVHALTDVTGYGLGGHALEMARPSRVRLEFESARLPQLPGALERVARFLSKGSENNMLFAAPASRRGDGVSDEQWGLFFDAQTSGGLLISVAPAAADALVRELHAAGDSAACIVGRVHERRSGNDAFISLV